MTTARLRMVPELLHVSETLLHGLGHVSYVRVVHAMFVGVHVLLVGCHSQTGDMEEQDGWSRYIEQ